MKVNFVNSSLVGFWHDVAVFGGASGLGGTLHRPCFLGAEKVQDGIPICIFLGAFWWLDFFIYFTNGGANYGS